jgi:hypothetical protein
MSEDEDRAGEDEERESRRGEKGMAGRRDGRKERPDR